MIQSPPVRTREDLAALLARKIASGEYNPGDLLPSERALSDEYGLSRSMVREALRTLAERRMIEVRPGRGSVVRETTVSDAVERLIEIFDHTRVTPRNLIEARSMIETTAAALAAERAGDRELEAITLAATSCSHADSLLDRVRWDLTFHLSIVKAAGNPLVETMFHAIQPYIVELLFRSLTDEEVSKQGLAFHERIVDAIERHDAEAASREMGGHLTLGITLFGADVDRNLNLVAQDALKRLAATDVTFEDVLTLTRES
ncbi:MAG TPA: FCD domain-containing protein [Thermomicrobiales bacterium]|nr:FCD domain-containing protein [Thermomicrobiales bacterium]